MWTSLYNVQHAQTIEIMGLTYTQYIAFNKKGGVVVYSVNLMSLNPNMIIPQTDNNS